MGRSQRIITEEHVVTTDDGAILATDVTVAGDGEQHPVLLSRTPYGRGGLRSACDPVGLARSGWAVVMQDVRGRFDSTGQFSPFRQEIEDGAATVDWCAKQPWSNGKVAMFGGSYVGIVQWLAALGRPAALRAIAPAATAPELADGFTREGGAFNLGLLSTFSLVLAGSGSRTSPAAERRASRLISKWDTLVREPISEGTIAKTWPELRRWHAAENDDPGRINVQDRLSSLDLPVFQVAGWYDLFCEGAIKSYETMTKNAATEYARRSQRLVIGPWTHVGFYGQTNGYVDWGLEANGFYKGFPLEEMAFLSDALEGKEVRSGVSFFILGKNRWVERESWPPPTTDRSLFFDADKGARGLSGDGRLTEAQPSMSGSDRFTHDPSDPVPTMGGRTMHFVLPGAGPLDQRVVEARHDVLVFTGERLGRDLTVVGKVRAEVWFESTAALADVAVKLVDVAPSGEATNIVSGIERVELTKGRARKVTVSVGTTAVTFKRGHKIRVEIASANFPQYDCCEKAEQTLRRGGRSPSRIILPLYSPES